MRCWILTADSDDVQIFLGQALRLLRQGGHDCKQSSEMEVEQRLWIGLQQGLQAFMKDCVTLSLAVVVGHEPALHRVLDGFKQKVALVQILAILGGLAVQSVVVVVVVRHVSQEAGKQDRLFHVVDGWAVAPQGQQQGASVEFGIGRLHGYFWWLWALDKMV